MSSSPEKDAIEKSKAKESQMKPAGKKVVEDIGHDKSSKSTTTHHDDGRPHGARSAHTTTAAATTTNGKNLVDKTDQGHRYGNFHNYYSFHPTNERIKLLGVQGGILDYIASNFDGSGLSSDSTGKSNSTTVAQASSSSAEMVEPSKKKPKMDHIIMPLPMDSMHFGYLDVGCNEGDLTMAVANELAQRFSNRLPSRRKLKLDLSTTITGNHTTKDSSLTAKGIDIDPVLISRAKRKFTHQSSSRDISGDVNANIQIRSNFQVVDVLSQENLLDTILKESQVHLTSIFSTTMWIHIHGGDEGLSRFLTTICQHTKRFIIMEAQPSKCYRNAMVRLRRMGLPELDVSADRLKLRPKIDDEIHKILCQQSFQRVVDFSSTNNAGDDGNERDANKTTWNRSIWLYERVASNNS